MNIFIRLCYFYCQV